ncbi:hypothetical protein [Pasteuria penetrans]|uniref:hypothetical protein n=1 Tax=Pasteuria penetrans TaxID=86005 RepID=UPI000F995100|nr:hypothetical protein [Pasteuria penetrans]
MGYNSSRHPTNRCNNLVPNQVNPNSIPSWVAANLVVVANMMVVGTLNHWDSNFPSGWVAANLVVFVFSIEMAGGVLLGHDFCSLVMVVDLGPYPNWVGANLDCYSSYRNRYHPFFYCPSDPFSLYFERFLFQGDDDSSIYYFLHNYYLHDP